MTNSEMEIEKLEVWNGPYRPPYVHELLDFAVPHLVLLVLNEEQQKLGDIFLFVVQGSTLSH